MLYDSRGHSLATVRSDVIYVDGQNLLVERAEGARSFRARATSTTGLARTVVQTSLTVSKLVGRCGDNTYVLQRTNPWRRERIIYTENHPALRTLPRMDGSLEVRPATQAAQAAPAQPAGPAAQSQRAEPGAAATPSAPSASASRGELGATGASGTAGADNDIDFVDAVFLTWCCVLVDVPGNRTIRI